MSTTIQSQRPLRDMATMFLIRLLSSVLSLHAKRLFYFASLYANLMPLDTLKRDVMGRLNSIMHLASSDDALMMPAVLSRVVWGQHDVAEILSPPPAPQGPDVGVSSVDLVPEKLEVNAYKLVSFSPQWMRFGPVEQMKHETMDFLRAIRDLQLAGDIPEAA